MTEQELMEIKKLHARLFPSIDYSHTPVEDDYQKARSAIGLLLDEIDRLQALFSETVESIEKAESLSEQELRKMREQCNAFKSNFHNSTWPCCCCDDGEGFIENAEKLFDEIDLLKKKCGEGDNG